MSLIVYWMWATWPLCKTGNPHNTLLYNQKIYKITQPTYQISNSDLFWPYNLYQNVSCCPLSRTMGQVYISQKKIKLLIQTSFYSQGGLTKFDPLCHHIPRQSQLVNKAFWQALSSTFSLIAKQDLTVTGIQDYGVILWSPVGLIKKTYPVFFLAILAIVYS